MPKDLTVGDQESSTEISSSTKLKSAFRRWSLLDFWKQQHIVYAALSDKAVHFFLSFATTYLCEKGLASLAVIKTNIEAETEVDLDGPRHCWTGFAEAGTLGLWKFSCQHAGQLFHIIFI